MVEDSSEIFSKVRVGYSYSCELKTLLYIENSRASSDYIYNSNRTLTHDTYLRTSSHADTLGERLLWTLGVLVPVLDLSMKLRHINKLLGDRLKVTMARAPFEVAGGFVEKLFEIYSINKSCFPVNVKIGLRDLMGYGEDIGYWTVAAAPNWIDATEEKRSISGYWTDNNGYAYPDNEDSKNVSRWW